MARFFYSAEKEHVPFGPKIDAGIVVLYIQMGGT